MNDLCFIHDLPSFDRLRFAGTNSADHGLRVLYRPGVQKTKSEGPPGNLQPDCGCLADDLSAAQWQENLVIGGAVSGPGSGSLATRSPAQADARGRHLVANRWLLPGTAENAQTGSNGRVRSHI